MPSHMHQPQFENRGYARAYEAHNTRPPSHHIANNGQETQRPGRGVYSQSGQRVHVGTRRQPDAPTIKQPQDKPPRLPARNPSPPIRNALRSQSNDRGGEYIAAPIRRDTSADRSGLTNEWARRHNGNPDWSYSSSESGQQREKPIDQLRNRVRLAQQKQQEQRERLTPDRSDSPTRGRPRSSHVAPVSSSIDFRNEQHRNSSSQNNHTNASRGNSQGLVTSEISRSPVGRGHSPAQQTHPARGMSPQARNYHQNYTRALSPDQLGFNTRVPTPDRSNRIPTPDRSNRVPTPDRAIRAPTPERYGMKRPASLDSKKHDDDKLLQSSEPTRARAADDPPTPPHRTSSQGRVRALSPPQDYRHSSDLPKPSSNRTLSPSNQPAKQPPPPPSSDSLPPAKPDRSFNHVIKADQPKTTKSNQNSKKAAAMEYSNEKPVTVTSATVKSKNSTKPASSNKYKMLVCPDFFPVSKLNGLPGRRRSRGDLSVPDEFADPPDIDNTNDSVGGFYSQLTNQTQPVQPVMTMDDSFIEDPKEQILYPSTTLPNRRSRSKPRDTADFYFEVNPYHLQLYSLLTRPNKYLTNCKVHNGFECLSLNFRIALSLSSLSPTFTVLLILGEYSTVYQQSTTIR